MSIIIFTTCTAAKDDSVPIPMGAKVVQPRYYLENQDLIIQLTNLRSQIFQNPKAFVGTQTTYAFDLYVRRGKAYKDLFKNDYSSIRAKLLSDNHFEWFFLSGGYGIIHALEKSKKYQATFNRGIANQKKIPFTAGIWNKTLILICEHIVSKFNPTWIYVFGSQDYTYFIKGTKFWGIGKNIKIFESTGSSGSCWLSPKLAELAKAVINNDLKSFNAQFPSKFIKQK